MEKLRSIVFFVCVFPFFVSAQNIRTDNDKIYMLKRGDTAVSIAEELTGDRSAWKQILQYNQLNSAADLKNTNHLLIPGSMLVQRNSVTPTYKIRPSKNEYQPPDTDPVAFNRSTETPSNAISEIRELEVATNTSESKNATIEYLPTENQDMFVGEIRMLGLVSVTRVAIGNGQVISAEVLKNG